MYQPPPGPNKPPGMFPPPLSQGSYPTNSPSTRPSFAPQGQFSNQGPPPPRPNMNGYGAPASHPPTSGAYAPPSSNMSPFQGGQLPMSSTANQHRSPLPPPSQGGGPMGATSGIKRPPGPPHPTNYQTRFGPPSVNQPPQPQVPPQPSSFQPRPNLPPTSAPLIRLPNSNGQLAQPNQPVAFNPDMAQNRPNELPVPFHGQGQYSHQVNPLMQKTPTQTPSNSEPTSRKSSRGASPVSGSAIDALEGQFSPEQVPQGNQLSAFGSQVAGSNVTVQQPGSVPPSNLGPPRPGTQMPATQSAFPPGPPKTGMPPMPPQAGQTPPRFQEPPKGVPSGMSPSTQPGSFPMPPTSMAPNGPVPMYPNAVGSQAPPPTSSPYVSQYGGHGAGPLPPPPSASGPRPGLPPPTSFAGGMPPPPSGQRPPLPNQMPGQMPPYQPPQGQPGMYNPQPHMSQMYQPGQTPAPPRPGAPGIGSYPNNVSGVTQGFNQMTVQDTQRATNLLNERNLIPPEGLETQKPVFAHDHKKVNCNPDVFRSTLNAIPSTSALLNKARLPLGILIHPFRDLSDESDENQLPVIQSSVIVRCRSCRTYINPFVVFVDSRRWKCNLCFRVNELPDEFSFDPVSKTYGDPQRRPEIKSATIEFIAPSEYMLRPPQPAVYLFLLDVSFNAVETGYLSQFSQILLEELDKLPGDARTSVGFICYDSSLYYFNLASGLSQPQMLCVPDLEDPFLPCPDNLLVNLRESKELISDLLEQLPSLFQNNLETGSALGAALQSAYKLMSPTGGRVTIMQTCLPTIGPGALQNRDTGSSGKNVMNIGPAIDFYKKLSLDCSAQQIAVDLFMLNGQFADFATISCISKYSGGCIYNYPSFHSVRNPGLGEKFDSDLRRYLTRKIGFESVMRIRCTRGLSIHTFHGNFFVRSTDLLSLPNINPDAGFGMQMSIEDNLSESSSVSFQAALLYTSSKGERRIRVHTLCVPVTNQIGEVFANADQQAIIALLAKMAVDRSVNSSLSDARDALINSSVDALKAYGQQVPASQRAGSLIAPYSLRLMPMLTLSMLKSVAFGLAANTRLDDRVFAMQQMKVMPVCYLIQSIYPHLYALHRLNSENPIKKGKEEIPSAPFLQLSSANIDRTGLFLMDAGETMYLYVGSAIGEQMCKEVFEQQNFMSIPDGMMDLPELENQTSEKIRSFVNYLMDSRPNGATFMVIREDSKHRHLFFRHMVEDRMESSMSYHEFLQFLQGKIKG